MAESRCTGTGAGILAVRVQRRRRAGQAVLGKRLAKFGLELHPTKTRLVDFRPPAERGCGNNVAHDLYVPRLSPGMPMLGLKITWIVDAIGWVSAAILLVTVCRQVSS